MSEEKGWFSNTVKLAKDVCYLVVIVIGAVIFLAKFYLLPSRVEASEQDIKDLQAYKIKNELIVQSMKQDLGYIVKTVDEVKDQLKTIDSKLKR